MKLGIIGCGAIGTDVAKAADKMNEIEKIFLYDIKKKASDKLNKSIKKGKIQPVKDFLDEADVVFEAASQKAVEEYAEMVILAGKDLVIMSVGSLFNNKFKEKLANIARKKRCKIYLPSGAVCGIDGILSASIDVIDEVTLVTTKSPEALGRKHNKRTVIFKGNAIVADPVVNRISHKILAHWKFGRLRAEVENMPNPNNPKSSYMASLSAIATLKKIINPIQIGA